MASSIPYSEFQVASYSGNEIYKWKADGDLHQNIFLSTSVEERELWRFEREENEPLWSFHILSDAGKLYVSYDEDNDVDDVTLELKNDESGKKRLFMLLVQSNDQYLFRAHDNEDHRYLRWVQENGSLKLEMITTKHLSEDMLWMVNKEFTHLQGQSIPNTVEVFHGSLKWISRGAQKDQPVEVRQNGFLEKWMLTKKPEGNGWTWMFSPLTRTAFSASSVRGIDEILFKEQNTDSDTRTYQHKASGGGWKLKNLASGKWLAVGPMSRLSQVEKKKDSVSWDIAACNLPYACSEKVYFFPSL